MANGIFISDDMTHEALGMKKELWQKLIDKTVEFLNTAGKSGIIDKIHYEENRAIVHLIQVDFKTQQVIVDDEGRCQKIACTFIWESENG